MYSNHRLCFADLVLSKPVGARVTEWPDFVRPSLEHASI